MGKALGQFYNDCYSSVPARALSGSFWDLHHEHHAHGNVGIPKSVALKIFKKVSD